MSVHVQFETPEDLANKIYDMIDLNKNGRVKKGSCLLYTSDAADE